MSLVICHFIMRSVLLNSQFPESHGSCCSDIEGVDAVLHGDFGDMGAGLNGCGSQSVAFGTHDDGNPVVGFKARVVDVDGIVAQCECHCRETQVVKAFYALVWPVVDVCPRHLENGAHADADAASVEGVAAGGREKQGVDAQSC